MELRDLIEVVTRRLWLLIAGAVLSMVGSYLALYFLTPWPRYQATATVIIGNSNPNSDWASLQVSKELAPTYARWATRRPVLQGAIDTLGLPLSLEGLKEVIDVRVVGETQLMEVSVTFGDPEEAAAIANEIVRQLETQIAAAAPHESNLLPPSEEEIVRLGARIRVAEAELVSLSDALANYRSASPWPNDIAWLEARISEAETELVSLSDALANHGPTSPPASDIERLETRINETEARLLTLTDLLLETDSTTEADLLTGRISVLQSTLGMWRGELDRLYARAKTDSEAKISHLLNRIGVLQSSREMWQGKLDRLCARTKSDSEAEIGHLVNRINVLQANLGIWHGEHRDLKAEYNSRSVPFLMTVEDAQSPARSASPWANVLVAGVTGLVLIAGLVLVVELTGAERPIHESGAVLDRRPEGLIQSRVGGVTSERVGESSVVASGHSGEGG